VRPSITSSRVNRRRFLCATGATLAFPFLEPFSRAEDIPHTVAELWAGFAELDRTTPLDTEILKAWEQDGVVCRLVRYQVGVFKGAPSRVAAFYAFPKGGTKLPALLDIHGGGQSASLDSVVTYAKRGYACISINWGGNKLNFGRSQGTYDGPQTDWGKLDATHPPQRNTVNHFAGPLTPDDCTLDAVESPRNSNWFLVLMAARRALSFLEEQPGVDPVRLGAFGHSMGGKLTTDLAGIDPRIKAAVPSCGGSGDVLQSQTDLPGCSKTKPSAMELACVSDNTLVLTFNCNAWGAFNPGKPAVDYTAVKELKGSPDWQPVSVSLNELAATDPKITDPLTHWRTVTEFSLSPSGETVKDGQKIKVPGKSWQGPREIRHLRWAGGEAGTMKSLSLLLTLPILAWRCAAQENEPKLPAPEPGKVTSHSQGLHGYIGFGHERLPPESAYTAGMGFYAAVWPLVDQPLADFQIGLPSSWIQPDNSDNKDRPLAPEGTLARTWKERGPTWDSVFQTVEGGLGYWAGNHYRYGPPIHRPHHRRSADG